jgi:KUP system potassium uptake protein
MLGFRVEPRLSIFFRKAIQDLMASGEVNIMSRFSSLAKHNIVGDFRFVVIDRVYNYDPSLSPYKQLMLSLYSSLKSLSVSEEKAFGLDTSSVSIEKVPLVAYNKASKNLVLSRINTK